LSLPTLICIDWSAYCPFYGRQIKFLLSFEWVEHQDALQSFRIMKRFVTHQDLITHFGLVVTYLNIDCITSVSFEIKSIVISTRSTLSNEWKILFTNIHRVNFIHVFLVHTSIKNVSFIVEHWFKLIVNSNRNLISKKAKTEPYKTQGGTTSQSMLDFQSLRPCKTTQKSRYDKSKEFPFLLLLNTDRINRLVDPISTSIDFDIWRFLTFSQWKLNSKEKE